MVLALLEQGLLLATRPDLLAEPSTLAAVLCGGLAFFWALRLYVQWCVYDRSLWRGRRFETAVHWAFTGLWTLFTGVFAWGCWRQVGGLA